MDPMNPVIESYFDGYPCKHPGCFNHVTHPCEYCGRIAGKGVAEFKVDFKKFILSGDVQGDTRLEEKRKRRKRRNKMTNGVPKKDGSGQGTGENKGKGCDEGTGQRKGQNQKGKNSNRK